MAMQEPMAAEKDWQRDTRAAQPHGGGTSGPRDTGPGLNARGWEHASAATRLLERRRQMFEVQERLEYQKDDFRQKEAEFKKREEKLEEKDVALQENLLKFSKFLQKKDTQRICADKKANDEIKIREQKEVEISELKLKLKLLKTKRDSVSAELKKNMKYKLTLDDVVNAKDDYNEIQDVVDRWTTLDLLRDTLDKSAKYFLTGNEQYKSMLVALSRDKQGEILEYNNSISSLKSHLGKLKVQSKKLIQLSERAGAMSQTRTLELGKIKMACDNIYERLSSRTAAGLKSAKPDDILEKLRLSGDALEDLIAIVGERKAAQEAVSETPASPRESPEE